MLLNREDGQGTVEYVLVILAAAALAMALISFVSGSGLIPQFFTTVVKKIIGFAG